MLACADKGGVLEGRTLCHIVATADAATPLSLENHTAVKAENTGAVIWLAEVEWLRKAGVRTFLPQMSCTAKPRRRMALVERTVM